MVSSLMAPTVKHVQNHNELSLNGSTVDQSLSDLTVDDPVDISVSGGHLDVQGSEINYVGATHWATILENVEIIKVFTIKALLIYCRFEIFRDFLILMVLRRSQQI